MAQTADFDQLMADVAAGSEEAVWRLAETYTPYILRAVRGSLSPRLRPKLDSQDFAQTLWASILLKRNDLSRLKTPEKLIAYLAQATRNKVIDKSRYYRSQKNDVRREEVLPAEPPDDVEDSRPLEDTLYDPGLTPSTVAGLRERWQQILDGASERDRKILALRLKGHTIDVICQKLSINQATARRAMQRLIEQLSD